MARSAVVTGSSSGIGRAIAVRLAADGFWVLLADIRRDPVTGGEPTDDLIRARGRARGRIVNIASQHGMVGAPGHAAYAVSKAGLIQLTRQIAVEYGRDGILCNGVAPGKVVTGTPGDLSQSETTAAYVRSRTPFARFGEPADGAAAVAFLASDDATYISGATLMVDGGWMAY